MIIKKTKSADASGFGEFFLTQNSTGIIWVYFNKDINLRYLAKALKLCYSFTNSNYDVFFGKITHTLYEQAESCNKNDVIRTIQKFIKRNI